MTNRDEPGWYNRSNLEGTQKGLMQTRYLLVDWGDTLMKVFPDEEGPMKNWDRLEVFPHAISTLCELKQNGWQVIMTTNAMDSEEADIWQALQRVGLEGIVDRIFCFRNLGLQKPDPAFFLEVLSKLGAQASQAVMLGDDFAVDIQGANRVSIPGIWFNPGSKDDRSGIDYCTIHQYQELIQAVRIFEEF